VARRCSSPVFFSQPLSYLLLDCRVFAEESHDGGSSTARRDKLLLPLTDLYEMP
jgi:hypothetical protein